MCVTAHTHIYNINTNFMLDANNRFESTKIYKYNDIFIFLLYIIIHTHTLCKNKLMLD